VRRATNPVMRRVCGSRNNHIQGTDGGIPQQIIGQQESKYKRERHSQSVETPTRPTVSSGYWFQEFTNAGFDAFRTPGRPNCAFQTKPLTSLSVLLAVKENLIYLLRNVIIFSNLHGQHCDILIAVLVDTRRILLLDVRNISIHNSG